MLRRSIEPALRAALADRPVVFLQGARQTGKSTLVRRGFGEAVTRRYLTLDDAAVLAAARSDPPGFIAGLDGPVTLDEVQRVPELFLAIKAEVDRKRTPGRFLLTGSAQVLALPRLSESLAGRMELLTLWPLSVGERERAREGFIDAVFAKRFQPSVEAEPWPTTIERILVGGYPELRPKLAVARRDAWFRSYVTTILQRDVRDLANIEGLADLPRLLALLATRSSSLLNTAELGRSMGIAQTSLRRYLTLLDATFLTQRLLAWSGDIGRRLVRTPKVLLLDSGLAAHLVGANKRRLAADPQLAGPQLESFVAMELRKQAAWSRTRPELHHYRAHTGQEVDIVLEDRAGRVVGVEVKAGATLSGSTFRGLRALQDATGDRFVRGIVLYTGAECVPFGRQINALPVAAMWRLGSKPVADP